MIIVEGCDNSGKTTLVSRLSEDLRLLSIVNRQRPPSLDASWAYLKSILPPATLFPTIFDRWQTISEPIYGPICRNQHLFTPLDVEGQFLYLMNRIATPLVIYCRPSFEKIMEFGDRPQMNGVIDNAPRLIAAYDASMAKLPLRVVRYNFEGDTYDSIKQVALQHYRG